MDSFGIIYDDLMAQLAGAMRIPLDRLRGKPGLATVNPDQEYYDRVYNRQMWQLLDEMKQRVEYPLRWMPIFQARVRIRRYRRFKGIRRPDFARRDR